MTVRRIRIVKPFCRWKRATIGDARASSLSEELYFIDKAVLCEIDNWKDESLFLNFKKSEASRRNNLISRRPFAVRNHL